MLIATVKSGFIVEVIASDAAMEELYLKEGLPFDVLEECSAIWSSPICEIASRTQE
jgi:hypothetical protein